MTTKYLPCEDVTFLRFVVRMVIGATRFSCHGLVEQLLVDYLWYSSLNHDITEDVVAEVFLITEYAGEAILHEFAAP